MAVRSCRTRPCVRMTCRLAPVRFWTGSGSFQIGEQAAFARLARTGP